MAEGQILRNPMRSTRPSLAIVALSLLLGLVAALPASAATPIDLGTWTTVQYEFFQQADAEWILSGGDTVATQVVNADASMLVSDFEVGSEVLEGTWRVNTDIDDDFIGFVFGYQNRSQYYLFDWKKITQKNPFGLGIADAGMSLKIVDVVTGTDPNNQDLWPTVGGTNVTLLRHNTVPWQENVDYLFRLEFSPGQFTVEVLQGATLLESWSVTDATYLSGRFGFYNYSQGEVEYSGFTREPSGDPASCPPGCAIAHLPPVECHGPQSVVAMEATGSPSDAPLLYSWSGGCTIASPSEPTTDVTCAGLGNHLLAMSVTTDINDNGAADRGEPSGVCDSLLVVQDTTPPDFRVPGLLEAECASPGGAEVVLRAAAVDRCSPVSISNSRTGDSEDASGLYRLGDTTVAWTFCDSSGNCSFANTVVRVRDTVPPTLSAGDRDLCLWPPNHGYVGFHLLDLIDVQDACDPNPAVEIVCRSDSPEDGPGDGTSEGDCLVLQNSTLEEPVEVLVRTERSGSSAEGRRYRIHIDAVDASGNRADPPGELQIRVPHGKPEGSCESPAPSRRIQ